jgi:hypothetical protein
MRQQLLQTTERLWPSSFDATDYKNSRKNKQTHGEEWEHCGLPLPRLEWDCRGGKLSGKRATRRVIYYSRLFILSLR